MPGPRGALTGAYDGRRGAEGGVCVGGRCGLVQAGDELLMIQVCVCVRVCVRTRAYDTTNGDVRCVCACDVCVCV